MHSNKGRYGLVSTGVSYVVEAMKGARILGEIYLLSTGRVAFSV